MVCLLSLDIRSEGKREYFQGMIIEKSTHCYQDQIHPVNQDAMTYCLMRGQKYL